MRLNCSDEEDYPGQFALFQGNCDRSLAGKAGQAALRRLEAALLAMPEKRLIRETLADDDGEVCALGAVARHEGCLPTRHLDDDPEEFGTHTLKFPRLVAWMAVWENDINAHDHYAYAAGPEKNSPYSSHDHRGVWTCFEYTPEERYERMLAWVRSQLKATTK